MRSGSYTLARIGNEYFIITSQTRRLVGRSVIRKQNRFGSVRDIHSGRIIRSERRHINYLRRQKSPQFETPRRRTCRSLIYRFEDVRYSTGNEDLRFEGVGNQIEDSRFEDARHCSDKDELRFEDVQNCILNKNSRFVPTERSRGIKELDFIEEHCFVQNCFSPNFEKSQRKLDKIVVLKNIQRKRGKAKFRVSSRHIKLSKPLRNRGCHKIQSIIGGGKTTVKIHNILISNESYFQFKKPKVANIKRDLFKSKSEITIVIIIKKAGKYLDYNCDVIIVKYYSDFHITKDNSGSAERQRLTAVRSIFQNSSLKGKDIARKNRNSYFKSESALNGTFTLRILEKRLSRGAKKAPENYTKQDTSEKAVTDNIQIRFGCGEIAALKSEENVDRVNKVAAYRRSEIFENTSNSNKLQEGEKNYKIKTGNIESNLQENQENLTRNSDSKQQKANKKFEETRTELCRTQPTSKDSKFTSRRTRSKRIRTTSTILSSYWKLIMASIVWWCYDTANCVQMKQQPECPMDCDCYDDFQEIYCDSKDLRMIPPDIPIMARKLSLRNNNIDELRTNIFKNSGALEELDLSGNSIVEIPNGAFFGLENLNDLDLSENLLQRIPTLAFKSLKSIKSIKLRQNPIDQILSWDFIQVRTTLEKLDLRELWKLKFLSNGAFRGLDKLKELSMSSTLSQFPNLQPLKNLKRVDLSNNRYRSVDNSAFQDLTKLEYLDISASGVKSITEGTFNALESLMDINLSYNNLTSLPGGTFTYNQRIQRAQLQMNPWSCYCDLWWLVDWLQNNPYVCSGKTCPKCRYPPQHNGMMLSNLSDIEDAPCGLMIIEDNYPPSVNASVGTGVKIPCPTVAPTADSLTKNVMWILPNGTTLEHGKYTVEITVLGTGALNFSKVSLRDRGHYTCSVVTPAGEIANSTIFLDVTEDMNRFTNTFFSTETTVISNPDPPPLIVTTPTTSPGRFTKSPSTTKPRRPLRTRPKTRQRTQPTTSPVKPQWMYTGPSGININPELGPPGSSVQQVMETTKIIIGCFIGITLVAALLLLIFYKMRKRNNPSDNRIGNQPITHENSVPSNLIGRFDEQQVFISEQPPDQNTGPPASVLGFDNNRHSGTLEGQWSDSCQPLLMKQCNDNNTIMTTHILPPPPEEMFYDVRMEPFVTTPSLINMTSQQGSSLSSKPISTTTETPEKIIPDPIKLTFDPIERSGPLEQGYDSLKFIKHGMPPAMKPINGNSRSTLSQPQFSLSDSQRELLTDLASSCQKVAQNRRLGQKPHPPRCPFASPIDPHLCKSRNESEDSSVSIQRPSEMDNNSQGQIITLKGQTARGQTNKNHPIIHPGANGELNIDSWSASTFDFGRSTQTHATTLPSGRRYGSLQQPLSRKFNNSASNLSQFRPASTLPQPKGSNSRYINKRRSSMTSQSQTFPLGFGGRTHIKGNGTNKSATLEPLSQGQSRRKMPIKLGSFDGILTHKETEI
ncbi:uncharacterized protein LOC120335738 isoform X2 [Styela clava]